MEQDEPAIIGYAAETKAPAWPYARGLSRFIVGVLVVVDVARVVFLIVLRVHTADPDTILMAVGVFFGWPSLLEMPSSVIGALIAGTAGLNRYRSFFFLHILVDFAVRLSVTSSAGVWLWRFVLRL